MKDPKTTISGILLVVASVAMLVSHALTGALSMQDIQHLVTAIAGLGLLGAADSQHDSQP